jgi:hypothetical protein
MDEEESNDYRVVGLTEKERAQEEERARREVRHLTRDELTEYRRRNQIELDLVYLKLGAMAQVIVRILDELIQGVRSVAASLSAIDAPWAQVHGKALLAAVQQAQVSRRTREGKILLGLPKEDPDGAAHVEWLRRVRSVDENSDWLDAACGYGMARDHTLRTVAAEAATALSAINQLEAKACATRLREVVATGISSR